MDECKIIRYETPYKEALRTYLHKIYPRYTSAYVDYCLQQNSVKPDEQPALLVVNSENDIVGCNLYFNTKAKVLGTIKNVRWSYNTFLDGDRRKTMGLDLMLETMRIPSWAIGLSEVNRKIQKKLKAQFFDGLYNYFFVGRTIFFAILKHAFSKKNEVADIDAIWVREQKFVRVSSANEMNIPSEGFWCNGKVDVEFIRDRQFFDYRFFKNKTHHYTVYQLVQRNGKNTCYFVVRPILFKGVPTLFLVDFRYDMNHPEHGELIVKAANQLATRSMMGGVFCMTNDPNISRVISQQLLNFKTPNDLLAPKTDGVKKGMYIYVTAADSDADFLR